MNHSTPFTSFQVARKRSSLVLCLTIALACSGVLAVLLDEVSAKPARPAPPSWRSLTASQNVQVRSIPRKKPMVNTGGWGASTEPNTTASVQTGAVVIPVPEKSPLARAAPTHEGLPPTRGAGTMPEKTASRLGNEERIAPDNTPLSPIDVVTTEVAGEEGKDKDNNNLERAEQPPVAAPIGEGPSGKQYCANISTAAADARFAWQKKTLLQTEQEVARRVAELDLKIAEYQKWLARRDEFSRKADAVVVNIYGKMKPDAAAQQLAILDEEIAAAVLTKLDARSASAVMNEMEPKRAARLTAIITGAAKGPSGKPAGVSASPAPVAPPSKDNGT